MKIQTILETYKHIPANSIRCVNEGMIIKGDNCVIRVIPNLKREIMVQVGDSFATGFSFYENSSLAEFHQGTMKISFNANDIGFLKQHNSKQRLSKNTMPLKDKILKTNKKAKEKSKQPEDIRIDINDRFRDFLKNLPINSKMKEIFGPIYMNIRTLCKEQLIIYSHVFQKDFFSNKPKARIISEYDMTKLQKQKEKRKLFQR